MKISYNWLKQFLSTDLAPQELSLILTNIGLEVESLEKVQPVVGGLEGLVIGHVLSREQHPDADRLSVTTVDVGTAEPVQIVCGAPNVAAGQKVVVATVGTTVYPNEGEPFKIKKSKIRGEVSEGMICAEDEIGLGHSHAGIMVLDESAVPGTLAKEFFKLEDDYQFEIGLTPNRADATSHYGVARDLAAYLKQDISMPDVSAFKTIEESLKIEVRVEDELACPRYSSVTISDVTVKASPDWLQDKLKVIGIRPINNIVDITNYVLHELGQPLHAFDADQIDGQQVVVRKCAEGTPFVTLDGIERKLSADDLMICDTKEPMTIAGVYGGKNSGVSEETKNIFLESAYFNAVAVRKTAKKHGLKTDASFRYERGTDPEITVYALKRAALLISEIAGGHISSKISDLYPVPVVPAAIEVSYKRINKLIGAEIPASEIRSIITSLGMEVTAETDDILQLTVPAYKVDVTRECDVTEEVLRIYGYNNIAIPSKINASLAFTAKPDREQTQHVIADMLTANGFLEIWCNSLTKGTYADPVEEAVQILNPLSSDLNVMRQRLLMPALESVAYNQKRKNSDLKFYEFGKTYHLINDAYVERPRLLLVMAGAVAAENWNHKTDSLSFYHLKAAVDAVISRMGISNYQTEELTDSHYAFGLKYFRGQQTIVTFGAVTGTDKKLADIDKDVYYADFDWALILDIVRKNKVIFKDIPKFPMVRRDLSMLVDTAVTFEQLKGIAFKTEKKLLKQVQVFDVYLGDKLPEGKKSYALNFTLQDDQQTLTDKQIDSVMQKIIANLEQSAKAEIRK